MDPADESDYDGDCTITPHLYREPYFDLDEGNGFMYCWCCDYCDCC